jgi:tetratricopeptide (TPR) repeat protein
MYRIAFALLITIQPFVPTPAPAARQDEIKDALAHAEALYYGARFNESITLLARVDDALKTQSGRVPEKINTKLRLALAYIGLNDTAKAKTLLMEVYSLDPDYVLDPGQFSPKVMTVAGDAKAEQTKNQCYTAQTDARTFFENGKSKEFLTLMRSLKSRCTALTALEPEAADSFYRAGVAAYRRNEIPAALSSFEATLALSPEHELALQYVDLIQSKQQLSQDRLLLQWQRDFDARQWTAASADYKQIVSANGGRGTAVDHTRAEYRKVVSAAVDSWNQTCAGGDQAAISAARNRVSEILPEPNFAEDIRAKMAACPEPVKPAPPVAEVKPAPTTPAGCFDMQSTLAMTRLKTRVDPVITNEMRNYLKNNSQVMVRVKVKISETGDVTVTGMQEGNPILNSAVRNAVMEWKFIPTRDSSGPRCVDTEIPFVIKLSQ